MNDIRENLNSVLKSKNALGLLNTLGYHSHRTGLNFANLAEFQEMFPIQTDEFAAVPQLLFQLTWEDLFASSAGPKQVDNTIMESYLFFAIPLKQSHYSRTALAKITRDLNHFANQPVMVIFTYGESLTLLIINRRLHQRDENRDVLEKVTLIKDISVTNPHRAHLDILAELSYERLQEDRHIDSFVALHEAWQQVLDTRLLNKQFYQELAILFTRLVGGERGTGKKVVKETGVLKLPSVTDEKVRKEFAVRLLGRLLFCWFLQKKTSASGLSLVPEAILSVHSVTTSRDLDFYHAVLEPLFFETLNKPLAERQPSFQTGDWAAIPFLNGGLFEPHVHDFYDGSCTLNTLLVPDEWLTELLKCFERYHFTIEENTPIEVQVAIDPEMLGQIFENLLAEINPETGETARKATGSYYTPREIVDYMVTESLKYFLHGQTQISLEKLDSLLSYQTGDVTLSLEEKRAILPALERLKILDPACGSGAFPMGILQKVMLLLQRVDPDCQQWLTNLLDNIPDRTARQLMQKKLQGETALWDYTRKLGILRECIYGVDIQAIAVEISRLRCFLSLMVEENIVDSEENRGILPLPNLAFKFVCANTLLGISKLDWQLYEPQVRNEVTLLGLLRGEYLNSQGAAKIELQKQFKEVQKSLLDKVLQWSGKDSEVSQLATWKPFEDESCAWFEPFWMFGVKEGFDVVIGNPPYISALDFVSIYGEESRKRLNTYYCSAKGAYDIFVVFIEKGLNLIRQSGILSYITPNKYLSAKYAVAIRNYILDHGTIRQLVDVSQIRIFEEASVYPVISFLDKKKDSKQMVEVLLPKTKNGEEFNPSDFLHTSVDQSMLNLLPENIWGLLLSSSIGLLSKLLVGTEPLEKFGSINATSTASEAEQYGNYFTNEKLPNSLKVINTGTINRYESLWGRNGMTHSGNKFLTPYLPLDKASVNQRRRDMYQSPKIIFAKMAKVCEAYIDKEGEYASVNTNCFYNPTSNISLEFVGGFCNSRLFMFFYEQLFGALRMSGGYYQFQAPQLRVMPFKNGDPRLQQQITTLVSQIIEVKHVDAVANTTVLEREIDQLVYELYGLSEEEIAVIEGK